jgi:hypothetical protein
MGQDPLVNRAARIRQLLTSSTASGRRWTGWPTAADPYILLTEGGVTMENLEKKYGYTSQSDREQAQGLLLRATYQRMRTDAPGSDGQGIGLFTNYLFYGDSRAQYDSGLFGPTGGIRASYNYWRCLPTCP